MLHEAGFPVWFVLALGALSLVQALRYRGGARAAEVLAAVAATLFAGMLATAWGAQLAFGAIRELPDPSTQHWIAFVGVKEALYNFDIACLFGIVAALVATVGRRRADVASAS